MIFENIIIESFRLISVCFANGAYIEFPYAFVIPPRYFEERFDKERTACAEILNSESLFCRSADIIRIVYVVVIRVVADSYCRVFID